MNEKKPTNPWTKSLFIWMGILLALVFFVQSVGGSREAPSGAMTYSQFVAKLNEGDIKSVSIATTANGNALITGKLSDDKGFKTVAPFDAKISDDTSRHHGRDHRASRLARGRSVRLQG